MMELTRSISSTRIGQPVLVIDVSLQSQLISADRSIERISSMSDEIIPHTMDKDQAGDT